MFSGVYVPSKAFGEFVELAYGTPHIDGPELKRRLDAGEDIALLDSRPFDEYHWITIPGAIDCPGGELVLRCREAVPSPDTLVVVNCGGRTRSIIGAQTSSMPGCPTILSLKDGTQGWHLAGFSSRVAQTSVAPLPGDRAMTWARQAAAGLADRFDARVIDAATLAQFERESDTHTLYRFDVRGPDEYRAGHRAGFRSAPGGQLVQATDTFIAVRQARIVLADSDGVRARATAAWLTRMGFAHVFVLDEAAPARRSKPATHASRCSVSMRPRPSRSTWTNWPRCSIAAGAIVVDVATSREYPRRPYSGRLVCGARPLRRRRHEAAGVCRSTC